MPKENLYIIKIGGNVIDDETALSILLADFAAIAAKKILVHGGGKMATQLAAQLGVDQTIVEGRRITDAATLRIVTMVYAGLINKNIVAKLQALGCNAMGLSGADGNLIAAHQRRRQGIDYGFAGDIDAVHTGLLAELMQQALTIVVAPITHDGHGQLLNTNADTIAQELARSLSEAFNVTLVYTFDKTGVLLDAADDSTVIPSITPAYYERLKKENKIYAGMIPKIDNAFAALRSGVRQVTIGKAEQLQKLISNLAGTNITNE